MADIWSALALTPQTFAFLAIVCVLAGMVRGFSGFALSAVVMTLAVLVLPPVEIIPIVWFQEMAASVLMVRGGWKDADRRVVLGLVLGSAVGLPFGLMLTQAVSPEISKQIALGVIITLALSQLLRIKLRFLASRAGLWGTGVLAGFITGLAHVGAMVVALYVLAQETPPRVMRASLVLFLFASSMISIITLVLFGVMNGQAALRGLALAPVSALGVYAGQRLFRPTWEPYYKPICLVLLIGLALASLLRELMM